MSNYPVWWDTTITVYNKYEEPSTNIVKWYKTVIPSCFWKSTGNKVNIGGVALDTDKVVCRIPENYAFLEKGEWIQLDEVDKNEHFTLGVSDLIFKGEIDEDIDEYVSGKRSSDILSKYKELQSCIEIRQVSINVGIGRNNPHYYVTGV